MSRVPLLSFQPRSRIAPTPSGFLHLGNAVAFVLTWALVRAHKGTLRLRIDDLDAPRMRPDFVEDLFEQLDWLGIDWDEGPRGPEDHAKRHSQRLRIDRYNELLDRLARDPRAGVYACDCSRLQVRQQAADGRYPGTCRVRGLALEGTDRAWRIEVPQGTEAGFKDLAAGEQSVRLDLAMGDFVIRRRDGIPGYHLASLADDLDFGIDFIVRGTDLRDSTAAQVFLASRLEGAERFSRALFFHHPILADPSGGKLSKSRDSSPLRELRNSWRSAEPVFRAAGALVGAPAVTGGGELIQALAGMDALVFARQG